MTLRLVPKPPETTRWRCLCPPCDPREWHHGTTDEANEHWMRVHYVRPEGGK